MAKILDVEGARVSYRDFTLGEISFSLDEGMFLGLVGPNGAGKTTLIKALLGITPLGSGRISLFGKELSKHEAWCKAQIGFALGESRFWESLSPAELGKTLALFYRDWDAAEYRGWLDRFQIPASKKAAKFSSGMKTRLYLATALSHHARLLVLDEPTAGLDPLVRRDVMTALGEYLAREGTSVIFSSHITSDLERRADMLLFLLGGQARYYGALDDFERTHARVRVDPAALDEAARGKLIGLQENKTVAEGITDDPDYWKGRSGAVSDRPSLEDIIVALSAEGNKRVEVNAPASATAYSAKAGAAREARR
jgi:ABC-2 type transport system ATP-binding protein